MNRSATTIISFVLGAAAGAAGAWYYAKKYYEQIAQEEIDSVKEVFKKYQSSEEDPDEDPKPEPNRATDMLQKEAEAIVEKHDYTAHSTPVPVKEVPETRPYVITPEEFGEYEDYEQIDLTFFRDNIVGDDEDDILENVDEVIGFESLNHFGEYEEEAVYVRNDRLKCDYAISLDSRTYQEMLAEKPYKRMGVL